MAEFLKIGQPKSKPNHLYAIISVALVLLLLGFFGMLSLHAQALVTYMKEQVNIIVELKEDTPPVEVADIEDRLIKSKYVKEESIKFISKEDALDLLREDFGEDFMKFDLSNPLYDVVIFNTTARYMNVKSLEIIRDKITQNKYVNDVYYQADLVDLIGRNISTISWVGISIGFFFIFVAIFLIYNTVRLSLYANRFLIKNMELVGASWEFISRPYLIRSVINGVISAFIAIVLLLLVLWWARTAMPELRILEQNASFVFLFINLILISVAISSISTYYVVHKYLRMRLDDLYR